MVSLSDGHCSFLKRSQSPFAFMLGEAAKVLAYRHVRIASFMTLALLNIVLCLYSIRLFVSYSRGR